VTELKTTLYTIPVEDKFIIYAPLKPLAFIGNRALANAVYDQFQSPVNYNGPDDKLIGELKNIGLFEPDRIRLSNCNSNQPFHPTLCILMPTTACNLACTYCYAAYEGKKHALLSWQVARKAIDITFQNSIDFRKGNFALSFHGGGEPTLPKELFIKASMYAKKLDPNCPISVTTNAVWDNEFRDKALDLLSEISISLDGNEITQNRQRPDIKGNGTFARVLETIREVEKRKIPYGIRMTVTKESLPELPANIEFLCSNTACNSFQVEAVYNQGRASGAGPVLDDIDTFVDAFMNVHHFAKEKGKSVHYSSARPHLTTNTFCTATSNALIVTSDGELTACYEVFDRSHILAEDFIIGRIDLKEGVVLYPGKREHLLERISANRNSCKSCFCYYHCAGDCPPKAFIAHHNKDEFRCSVTRAITRELILDMMETNNGIWQGGISERKISIVS
jgi:uncharacterized protein